MTLTLLRKLKINKKFQPLPMEDGEEFYPNGIFIFNVTKLATFIKSNPEIFQRHEIQVKDGTTFTFSNLNEETIKTANLTESIILAEIAPNRFNMIDGNHRLEKAYRDGIDTIFAYRVHLDIHVNFLTSKKAYEDYVRYWNSKLAEINQYK